ncbi:AAA family ATPase [Candidatus Palauibacter sp.]|uniref:AAA family ATPase n=1 Tax=Candidatus Palauibacter sp. TaxID=3101350 RepID=UPI003C6FAE05
MADEFGGKHIRFNHVGLDAPVVLGLESKGTRRLLHLLPLIKFALDVTGLAVLDEIDGDLHVDMSGEILSWFRSRESNPRNAQLLVSSHHVGLLDDLEKEEVFIVEKDDSGATRVYGAQDVQGLRRDVRLYSKYRAGVLGGLPRFG